MPCTIQLPKQKLDEVQQRQLPRDVSKMGLVNYTVVGRRPNRGRVWFFDMLHVLVRPNGVFHLCINAKQDTKGPDLKSDTQLVVPNSAIHV